MTSEEPVLDPSPVGRSSHPHGEATRVRIAIADDDPETLELLTAILGHAGVEIHTATSGAELVVLLTDRGPFDLIVTDIDMPWAEGLTVIHSARASQLQIPVVFVSGLARPDLADAVARLGNARLLRKPVSASDLRQVVAEMLEGRR